MKEHSIEVRGDSIRLLEAGSGPPLLYLHGIDGPMAEPMLVEVARSYRVIVPELPGFGRSLLPSWLMNIGDAAYFGLDLIEALKVDRVHLAGHSIGGWIASE